MPWIRYIQPVNYRAIAANLGLILRLLGIIFVVPLIMSLAAGEFIYSFIFGGLAAGNYLLGRLASLFEEVNLSGKEALVVTALAYLLFALFGALAFLPELSFVDGFFESMSGFTTTGLTVVNAEQLPSSLLFFRAYSQWLGGAGIIVMTLVVLAGPGRSAFQLYTSEFGEEKLVGDVKATARIVLTVYLTLTILGYGAFVAAGMGPFDAMLNIFATVSTGGFAAQGNSMGYYSGTVIHLLVVLFMISGAIGFPSYYLLRHRGFRRFFRDLQFRYLLIFIAAASLVFWGVWGFRTKMIVPSIFHAATAMTTTGFSLIHPSSWPKEILWVTILLMLIGGSAGSTAGGLKLFRILVMFRLVRWLLSRALLPEEAKLPIKYGDMVIPEKELKQIFGFFAAYLGLICASVFFFSLYGFGLTNSLFDSVSALGTVGLSSGVTSASLPVFLKIILIIDMWAGRLEILPVLVVFYPAVWISKRRKK